MIIITALTLYSNDINNCTHQHSAHPQSVVYYSCQLPHRELLYRLYTIFRDEHVINRLVLKIMCGFIVQRDAEAAVAKDCRLVANSFILPAAVGACAVCAYVTHPLLLLLIGCWLSARLCTSAPCRTEESLDFIFKTSLVSFIFTRIHAIFTNCLFILVGFTPWNIHIYCL